MRTDLRDVLEEVMSERMIADQNLLNPDVVGKMKKSFLNGTLQDFERFWFVFTLM